MDSQLKLVRFLMIDDDEDHAKLVSRSLEKEHIANPLIWFPDGIQGLRYLRREGEYANAPLPDVILLDLKLPMMDGHEVLTAIKADDHLKGIPVVILTTSKAETDLCYAYQLNANSYLVKPIDMISFRQMVHDLSLYWGVWNVTRHNGKTSDDEHSRSASGSPH